MFFCFEFKKKIVVGAPNAQIRKDGAWPPSAVDVYARYSGLRNRAAPEGHGRRSRHPGRTFTRHLLDRRGVCYAPRTSDFRLLQTR